MSSGEISVRDLCRMRRQALSSQGKTAVPRKPGSGASASARRGGGSSAPVAAPVAIAEVEEKLDSVCSIVEEQPSEGLSSSELSVRELCRMRRHALSSQGKAAVPRKPGNGVSASERRNGNGSGTLQGREAARQHRANLCQNGRGDAPVCRPSGRQRPNAGAPSKVEVSTTLSGHHVTGTRVERASKVTGNEPGTCRAVTGTEYISAEQFESFCEASPAPAAAKVGMSATSRGQWVSGTEVGRSSKVTGDEPGSCRPVTGSEYLGSEQLGDFCQGKGLLTHPEKVVMGTTARRGMTVSGSDEARANHTTGTEAGASRAITGSQYSDAGAARLTINGPSKVALTHTLAGRPVSGTEVGRSKRVTGDEAGSCRAVSGTEYLSNEQFQSVCQTRVEPGPAKVGEDSSQAGQRITGNLVDRTQNVTGNEAGSCERVTGSQYAQPNLCGGGAEKVGVMHTLAGRALTGSRIDHSPKLSGDEHGGCQPVTGTEYYGQEQFASFCPSTPAPAAAKVGISQSGRGLAVSGTMLGRTGSVTGNEPGSSLAISGTPYAGKEQITAVCGCGCGCDGTPKVAKQVARPVEAGRRSRYLASSDQPMPQSVQQVQVEQPRPEGFSVATPARSAQSQRITGNAYGSAGRITGPLNMGSGLISGTPEFRYRDDVAIFQPAPAVQQMPEAVAVQRITGEGRADGGMRITGDDWARSGSVTGTEGHWAQGRNPTLRGEARQTQWAQNAWANKERERPEALPSAKVTGSSGNGGKGAMVTVSGGARG